MLRNAQAVDQPLQRISSQQQVEIQTLRSRLVEQAAQRAVIGLVERFDSVQRVLDIEVLFTNELDQGAYMSQTLATDETADELAARVAIYRMMRPGEPPTEDAVQALFGRLFYNEDTYDLSRVGRMKFNARVGRDEGTGPMTLSNDDILSVVKILVALAVAHTIQCPYCIDAYTSTCLAKGADEEQMMEAVHVSAAIRAGASLVNSVMMMNQVKQVVM